MKKDYTTDSSHHQICEYNPDWPKKFATELEKIKHLLGDKILQIEHIGSTSIPGLGSKPIIDIAILISSWKDADDIAELLIQLNYPFSREDHSDPTKLERHFLTKGDPTEFHISIAYADKGSFLERQILFRDYLREHPESVKEYDKLKRELIEKYPTGGDGYIGEKTDFIMSVLKRAGFKNKWFDLSKY